MPRTIDLRKLKATTVAGIDQSRKRIDDAIQAKSHYLLLRWMCLTTVELHQTRERYVEMRPIAARNHNPRHFLASHRVSYGLATYINRGGNRYFDFRSMGELIDKADTWVANNMFKALPAPDRNYIDALAAIRNCVVQARSLMGWAGGLK